MDREQRAKHRRETWESGVFRGGAADAAGDLATTDALWWARATEFERLRALHEMVRGFITWRPATMVIFPDLTELCGAFADGRVEYLLVGG